MCPASAPRRSVGGPRRKSASPALPEQLVLLNHAAWAEQRTAHFARWKNGYWLARRAFGSKARVVYGDIYRLPRELSTFDVVICCAVLEHVADPIGAIAAMARHAADRLVLGVYIPDDTTAPIAWFLGRADRPGADAVFWAYSMVVYREVLAMLGFEIERAERREFRLADGTPSPRTTIVARRLP
jgi:SAM-dependent methyltransferase